MRPGEISGPIETQDPQHIFIMKLEDKSARSMKSLSQLQRQLERAINLERRKAAADRLDAELAGQAKLAQTGKFVDLCLERIYRMNN
jgi:parvulin-like peptidyl-prolyl isomerase